jgi:NitT/TauT family transport system ATP-binding protein
MRPPATSQNQPPPETRTGPEAHLASGISIDDLSVAFQDHVVLDGLSLRVAPGEIVALVGASGCGKSTLLRAIARLVPPDSGSISFCAGPKNRRSGDLAYVFQDPTLLPWRTVAENVGLPLELGLAKDRSGDTAGSVGATRGRVSCSERINEALAAVGLSSSAKKFPRALSGGMRMRTSIARALVTDPNVLLLDEPFAALDDLLRSRLNDLILELWEHRSRTILFVTHNIAEAVYLSHRIAVLGKGVVRQTIDNSLGWPRTSAQRSSVEFAELYGQVSQALAEGAS